jgi:rhomboid domain-containing protein 1
MHNALLDDGWPDCIVRRHLFFNCTSLIWKGVTLEPKIGTVGFMTLFFLFLVLSQLICLAITWVFEERRYMSDAKLTCSIGISGVLFALKV